MTPISMHLRDLAVAAITASLVAACGGSDLSAPPPPRVDQVGTYRLATIIGEPLPAVVMHQLNYNFRRVITSGQLSLDATNDYSVQISWRDVGELSGAVIDSGTDVEQGHYALAADSLQFSDWVEQARDSTSIGAFGPIIMRTGKLQAPQLDAPVYFLVATFDKE